MGCSNSNSVDVKERKFSIPSSSSSFISVINKPDKDEYIIKLHNYYRKKHGCPDLIGDSELNEMATEYAQQLIESKTPIFSSHTYKGQALGENIFKSNQKIIIENICKEWYEEYNNYNYNLNKFQKGTNHFTQLIWKDSTLIGFGLSSNENTFYLVVYYFPAGNIFGEFDKNVPKKK